VPVDDPPPAGLQAQTGLIGFELTDVNGAADITIDIGDAGAVNAYWKYLDGQWVDATSIATFHGDGTVTLHLQDNGPFDTDPAVGRVVDPGVFVLDERYGFSGFDAPIVTGGMTTVKPGSTVPLRWRLTDHSGAPLVSPSAYESHTFSGTSCPQTGSATAAEPKVTTRGNHTGRWQLSWTTAKSWRDTCTMVLALGDGTTQRFEVTFR
jgi:hypothetical protein